MSKRVISSGEPHGGHAPRRRWRRGGARGRGREGPRAWVVVGIGLLAGACKHAATTPEPAGCAKDTDCKGERICRDGACVDPPGPEQADAPPKRAKTEAAWYRGGPGGVSPVAATGPAEAPSLAWDVDLGAVVFARPALAKDASGREIAYVGTHAGRFAGVVVDGPDAGKVVLDLTLSGMVWGTAAVDAEGRLYVGTDDDKLHAIDPAKGEVAWTFAVGACEPTRAPGPEGARCDADGGPTIGPDGDLYLGADGVYRIGRDGKPKWHYPDGDDPAKHVFSAPLVAADGSVYFGGQDGFLTALDENGAKRWQYTIRADVDGSAALGIDGTIYVGADDGRIHAVRSDGSLKWSFVTQKDIRSSIAVARDGTVYATSFDGNLYAIEPDGNVRWVLPTGGRIMSSPIVDAADNVFFGSQDHRVYAVSPQGKVLWTFEVDADVDGTVAISSAGTLVVGGDDGHLRALR